MAEITITELHKDGVSAAIGGQAFFASVYSEAFLLDKDNCAYGLLGAVMTAEKYAELPDTTPWAPLQKPAEFEAGQNAVEVSVLKMFMVTYGSQQKDLAKLKRALVIAVGPDVMTIISEGGVLGTFRRTPAFIMRHVETLTVMTAEQLQTMRLTLHEPYDPISQTFENHVAKHTRVHTTALEVNQGMPQSEKVAAFLGSLELCGFFGQAFYGYKTDVRHSTTATQTFENVVAYMRTADGIIDKTSSNGYGMKEGASATVDDNRGRSETRFNKKHPTSGSKSPVKHAAGKKVYCWTHGFGGHDSKECKKPDRDHNVSGKKNPNPKHYHRSA